MTEFERTFDRAARVYDNVRPFYADALYRDIFRYHPVTAGSDVLEIGVGTGKATLPFLNTKCRLLGLEPGAALSDFARARFAKMDNFSIQTIALQDFAAPDESFDLIYAATAFHWIPEAYGYPRVFNLLKRGGAFARFAYHAGPDQSRPALAGEIQALYNQYMPGTAPSPFSEADAQRIARIAPLYGFSEPSCHLYAFTKDFSADRYVELLSTYPNHMALEDGARAGLLDGIHALILRHGGTITVFYTMDLELARKP